MAARPGKTTGRERSATCTRSRGTRASLVARTRPAEGEPPGARMRGTRGDPLTRAATGTTPGPLRSILKIRPCGTSPRVPGRSRHTDAAIPRRSLPQPERHLGGAVGRAAGSLSAMPYALVATRERLFAGLANGELWESRNRGDSWQRSRSSRASRGSALSSRPDAGSICESPARAADSRCVHGRIHPSVLGTRRGWCDRTLPYAECAFPSHRFRDAALVSA